MKPKIFSIPVILMIAIFSLGVIFFACNKDFSRQPKVVTDRVDIVLSIAFGKIVDAGTGEISDYGFCWDTLSTTPDLNKSTLKLGKRTNTGIFQGQLTGLRPSKTYHLRAFLMNDAGVIYGKPVDFTTGQIVTLPVVTAVGATSVTTTTAQSGGNVTSDGGSSVTSKGVCWNTSSNPTTANSKTNDGSGTGTFVSSLTSLASNTLYYVRSFATNIKGTAYGNEISFTTLANIVLPSVKTTIATNITPTSATGGGNVTSDGGSTVIARGVCWSTYANPSTAGSHTTDGAGSGTFISTLTDLTPNTIYYVRSYASNSVGTEYGNEITFITLSSSICGQELTYEGINYNTVQIGTQCWFRENLNIGIRIMGSQNQTDNGIIEKYCYNDDEANCNTYGGLYQWNEMMQYLTTAGVKGICPEGWHLPTDAELTMLCTYLGGYGIAGGKMKSIGTIEDGTGLWFSPNTGATNESAFTAVSGGFRRWDGSSYQNIGYWGVFWSSSELNTDCASNLSVIHDSGSVFYVDCAKNGGFSVRCVRE